MLQRKHFEAPILNKRKVLLVGAEPSVQGLISTFLVTMGWICTVAATQETVPDVLQREAFDAVLIDLGLSVAAAEWVILRIKQIRPSLTDRIVVISNGSPDREMTELVERHDLVQVSQEGVLQQLWSTLQDLIAPSRPREAPLRGVQAARLIFDSFRYPLPAGVRGVSPGIRQVAYQYKQAIIDLAVDFTERPGRISLAGQVLDGERKGKNEDLSVLLMDGTGTLVRTATNQFGEFQMEFELADDLSIQVRLGERSWVLIPLGKTDWVKNIRSSSQAGD
jgi:CheY-like chemotaxis protein